MAGIVALVNAISADLVAKMSAAGLPPLTDGQIVLGKSRRPENSFPPRVVFMPLSFRYGPPSPGTNSAGINPQNPNAPGAGVRAFAMTAYGSGYQQASTTVTLSAPDIAGGTQATAAATVSINGAVTRIVPVVTGSGYLKPPTVTIGGVGTGAAATSSLRPTPQALTVITQRPLLTEFHTFEVHCWGVSSVNGTIVADVSNDYDATQQLYQQVIASAKLIAPGVTVMSAGEWFDSMDNATTVDVVGHDVRFMMEVETPLVAEPMTPTAGASVQIAPPGTQANPTLQILPYVGGTPEAG